MLRATSGILLSAFLLWMDHGYQIGLKDRSVPTRLIGEASLAAPLSKSGSVAARILVGGSTSKLVLAPDVQLHAGTEMSLALSQGVQLTASGRAGASVSGEAGLSIVF
jgi:hypothetical protein